MSVSRSYLSLWERKEQKLPPPDCTCDDCADEFLFYMGKRRVWRD